MWTSYESRLILAEVTFELSGPGVQIHDAGTGSVLAGLVLKHTPMIINAFFDCRWPKGVERTPKLSSDIIFHHHRI